MAAVIKSMTGFARAEGRLEAGGPAAWSWEAKSVNGKNLEVRVRVPHGFESLEIPARQAVAEVFARGSVNLSLTITSETASVAPAVDEAVLDGLIALAARKVATGVAPASLDGLIAMAQSRRTEVIDAETLTRRDASLLTALKSVVANLAKARSQEGAQLAPVVMSYIDAIAGFCTEARALAATQPAAIKAKLFQQVAELTAAVPALAPDRLAQEAVLLATKADIREELDRLAAHVTQARELLTSGEPCGRRLDFLSQEFNREANTLCSKSGDVALTRIGLALKTAIDQFREQIQNIE